MEIEVRNCTLLAIGQTGAGKSELGNAYLEDRNLFDAAGGPDSVTTETLSQEKVIHAVNRIYIDTQGLNDTEGVDAKHIQQMVDFLRNWKNGVNAVVLVINGQSDRLDKGTQRLIKFVHTFFNNPDFWNHTCIVFTKNYRENPVDEKKLSTEYKQKVQNIIIECIGNIPLNHVPQIPTFFVDSKKYDTDNNTKSQLAELHGFAYSLTPLSTEYVVAPDFIYMRKEKQNRYAEKVGEKIIEEGNNIKKKIITYEDQEREKQWDYDNHESYTEWKMIKRWEETKMSVTATETQKRKCIRTERKEIMKMVSGGGGISGEQIGTTIQGILTTPINPIIGGVIMLAGLFGGEPEIQTAIHDYYLVTSTYQDCERDVTVNFEGDSSSTEWRVIKEYTEESRE
jgi:hypothetical protein